jgi:hypothetical protein
MRFEEKHKEQTQPANTQAQKAEAAQKAEMDAETLQALAHFRQSVHAWSDAEMSRPRASQMALRRTSWRLAAGWALGCALVAGMGSGALYERHHQAELAKIAAQREAEHQRQLAAQQAKDEEDLLARVDSDVSKEVPNAMEPLAQLMAEDER